MSHDSRAPDEPKDPEGMLIFDWLELLLPADQFADLCRRAREGGENGPGYGELKKRIMEAMESLFGPARGEYEKLRADNSHLDRALEQGAEKARQHARIVRDRAYKACGLR